MLEFCMQKKNVMRAAVERTKIIKHVNECEPAWAGLLLNVGGVMRGVSA